MKNYHLPTKSYDIIAAINRYAAATGSISYAMATSHADYNGHYIRAYFNDYRKYYVAEYQWGERVVIARGNCFDVLKTAIDEYRRQPSGASLMVSVNDDDYLICEQLNLIKGELPDIKYASWYTWKHAKVSEAFLADRYGLPGGITDLLKADNIDMYKASTRKAS